MGYSDYFIGSAHTVADAMELLERSSGRKILFVASEGRVCGVVTDGDIRRYLLAGRDIKAPVMDAASHNPITVSGYHEARARALLKELDIHCVPMTDRFGLVHALVFADMTLHREPAPTDTPVIMMAGGLGTRLKPYTEILPKPLIPVGNITITEHILNHFKKFGCYSFYLVVNHKRNLIKSYFSETDTGASLEFIDEDKPLGTGGGLSFFKGRFDRPALVTYCDAVIEADYGEILERHIAGGCIATIICARKTLEIPYGVVKTSGDGELLASLSEKPSSEFLINTGLYVVSPEFIERVPDDTFSPITDIIERLRAEGERIGVYSIDGECFIDIGQLEDLHGVEDKLR
jgi:dTDP-glucose pyrophosphorylase